MIGGQEEPDAAVVAVAGRGGGGPAIAAQGAWTTVPQHGTPSTMTMTDRDAPVPAGQGCARSASSSPLAQVVDEVQTLDLPPSLDPPASPNAVGRKLGWTCASALNSAGPSLSRYNSRMELQSPSSLASTTTGLQKHGSGRFSQDEMLCFRRVPTPSSGCDSKAELYWRHEGTGAGDLRRTLSETNWHSLPVLKGKFFSHPQLNGDRQQSHHHDTKLRSSKRCREASEHLNMETLDGEALTASVLEEIFPQSPGAPARRASVSTGEGRMSPSGNAESPANACREPRRRFSIVDGGPEQPQLLRIPSGGMNSNCFSTTSAVVMAACSLSRAVGISPSGCSLSRATATSASTSPVHRSTSSYPRGIMFDFRNRLLKMFPTIKDAFLGFEEECPAMRDMTKKEFRRVMSKQAFASTTEERDAIFDELDVKGLGHICTNDFHIAIEAATPVKTVEDLRRRWIASGFPSMAHAIAVMDEDGANSDCRLTLRDFSEVLNRAFVTDHLEQLALFNAIASANGRNGHDWVSIAELGSAVATVSPALFLEDIRHRLMKKYGGSVERAFSDLEGGDRLGRAQFLAACAHRLGLSDIEVLKTFKAVCSEVENNADDADGPAMADKTYEVVKSNFLRAFSMSDSSLFLEDLRRKVRQRSRSVLEAFRAAQEDAANTDLAYQPKLSLSRFQELLARVELTDEELKIIFDLADVEGLGVLTINEFSEGVRHFAPSCVLEDLRLQCLQRCDHIVDVFANVTVDRGALLDIDAFVRLLSSLDLASGVQLEAVFDLIDVRNDGLVSLGRLVAALQSGGPGSNVRLPSRERNQRAKQDICGCMAPVHKLATDLKTQVRQGLFSADGADGLGEGGREVSPEAGEGVSEAAMLSTASIKTRERGPNSRQGIKHQACPSTSGAIGRCRSAGSVGNARAALASRLKSPASNSKKSTPSYGRSPPEVRAAGGQDRSHRSSSSGGGREPSGRAAGAKDQATTMLQGIPPRLRAMPQEGLAKYVARLDPARITDHKKIAQCPIQGAQDSWSEVWRCLHRSPGHQDRAGLEKDLQGYFQTATWSMSHDVPLLQRSHSRYALHQSTRAHHNALAKKGA